MGRRSHLSRTRRKKFTFVILTAFILAVMPQIILFLTLYPNTSIGGLKLASASPGATKRTLTELSLSPVSIEILDRRYSLSYQDLGVTFDEDAAITELYKPNRLPFPKNITAWISAVRKGRQIMPPLVFTERYERFVNSLVIDDSQGTDSLSVDEVTKLFVYHELGKRYAIDGEDLKRQIIGSFGSGKTVRPQLKKLPNPTKYVIEDINRKLTDTYRNPLELVFTIGNKSYKAVLTGAQLREIIRVSYSDETRSPSFEIDRNRLTELLSSRQTIAGIPESRPIPIPETSGNILSVINARYSGETASQVFVALDSAKTRLGKLAPKYAEVDLAEQELSVYVYGNLLKTYPISSGAEYPTPTGWFKILNKAPNAFSTIYNVYMPYWMAFGYSDENRAYFGFHELPYTLNDKGTRVDLAGDAVGVPSTGGCIALDIGDAKEFYTFAEVGTPVYIYN